jgi:peptidyl-prolyl cis-trans isomerase D
VAVSVVRPYVESIPKKTRKAELIKAKMTGSSLEVIAKAGWNGSASCQI